TRAWRSSAWRRNHRRLAFRFVHAELTRPPALIHSAHGADFWGNVSAVCSPQAGGCRSQMSKWGAHVRSAVRRRGRSREAPSAAPPGTSVKARLPFAISWKWLGQVVALLTASVTERRQHNRRALWQVEERFRLLVESAKGYAIYMLDAEGRIATWSTEAERIKGYRAEEIIGKSFHTFFTPEDIRGGVPEQVLRTAREEGEARYEGWRVRKDGSRFCVEGVITAIRDESGALNGYSKVAHDVTERKQAEEVLRESETRFRTLAEGLPQLVWTCLPDGRCDYLSPQWVRYTGLPEEELLGFGWLAQVDPDDRERAAAAWKGAVEKQTKLDGEFRIRGADGAHRWFKARAVPLRDS